MLTELLEGPVEAGNDLSQLSPDAYYLGKGISELDLGYVPPAGIDIWFDPDSGVYSDLGITEAVANDPVHQWSDRTGNHVLIQNVLNSRPLLRENGIGTGRGLQCDGIDDLMTLVNPVSCGKPYTSFNVVSRANAAHKIGGLIGSEAGNPVYSCLFWFDGNVYFLTPGVAGRVSSINAPLTGPVVVTTIMDGVNHFVWFNGVPQVMNIVGNFNYSTDFAQIGFRWDGYFTGLIGEMMHYSNQVLSTANREDVEAYLIGKIT